MRCDPVVIQKRQHTMKLVIVANASSIVFVFLSLCYLTSGFIIIRVATGHLFCASNLTERLFVPSGVPNQDSDVVKWFLGIISI